MEVGKWIVIAGIALVVIGLVMWIGRVPLGRLPGDINVAKGNASFHFPIVTCLVVSAILTLLMWLFRR